MRHDVRIITEDGSDATCSCGGRTRFPEVRDSGHFLDFREGFRDLGLCKIKEDQEFATPIIDCCLVKT